MAMNPYIKFAVVLLIWMAPQWAAAQQIVGGGWNDKKDFLGGDGENAYGRSATSLFDVDGDTVVDYVIGVPYSRGDGQEVIGKAVVISGKHFEILQQKNGSQDGGRFGWSVVRLEDVNGDDYPDYVVGAPGESRNNKTANGSATVYSGMGGQLLRRFVGTTDGHAFGSMLSSITDLNGDGLAEIFVGGTSEAGARLFAGGSWSLLFEFPGQWEDIGSVGDLDGDNIPDLALTRLGPNGTQIYSGHNGTLLLELPGGRSVTGIDDLNQDGVDEILIGNSISHIYSGATGELWTSLPNPQSAHSQSTRDEKNSLEVNGLVDELPGNPGQVGGQPNGDWFGETVLNMGDLNSDAVADFAISNPLADHDDVEDAGAVFFYDGASQALFFEIYGEQAGGRFGMDLSPTNQADGLAKFNLIIGAGGPDHPGNPGQHRPGRATTFDFESFLTANATSLSVSEGGIVDMEIDFPRSEAGMEKVMLLSLSGNGPTQLKDVWIPLTDDAVFYRTLNGQYPETLFGARGTLDENGDGAAFFRLWPDSYANLIGSTIHAVVLSATAEGKLRLPSAAIPMQILP